MSKVNIHEKLDQINDHWNPRIVGKMNGQQIRLAKLLGNDFAFHHHPTEEMFFMVNGEIDLEFEDHKVTLTKGDFYIIPRGIRHRPVARQEAEIMLFVNEENVNTGDVENDFTLRNLESL